MISVDPPKRAAPAAVAAFAALAGAAAAAEMAAVSATAARAVVAAVAVDASRRAKNTEMGFGGFALVRRPLEECVFKSVVREMDPFGNAIPVREGLEPDGTVETDAQGLAERVYKATCAVRVQSSWGISARLVPSL